MTAAIVGGHTPKWSGGRPLAPRSTVVWRCARGGGSRLGDAMKVRTQFGAIQGQRQTSQIGCERPGAAKLRLLFVTEEDPLYVIRFFDIFFAEYPRNEFEICGITVDRAFHEPIWKTLRRMQAFYGRWDVLRQGMRFVQARLRGRSIEALARTMGVPVLAARSVNRPEYIEQLQAMALDIIVSVAAPEIFKAELLAVPQLGCINVHCGGCRLIAA
jgi:hypothetical protein